MQIEQAEFVEVDRQLPTGDEIFLDHVGHFVSDPEAASRALIRAGFGPAPRSIHFNPDAERTPTGTGNITAMLPRGYVEVLFKTADTPLAQELDAAMARYVGVHLAAFSVRDAAAAHQRLGEAGFPLRPLVEMQRPVDTLAGTATAAFTVARVERGAMAEGRIQILTHHTELAVWQPRWLVHLNGAHALSSVAFVVADPDEAAERFSRFTGRPARQTSCGQTIALDRGRVDLVDFMKFATMLPEVEASRVPFGGAYGVVIKSIDAVERLLQRANLCTRRLDDCLIVPFPHELGVGAWIFTETSQAGLFG
jgi:Glyoxalase-like domain